MDMLGLLKDSWARRDARPGLEHEFLTHDQRCGDARELEFDELDARERAIFLRCGFHAPQVA